MPKLNNYLWQLLLTSLFLFTACDSEDNIQSQNNTHNLSSLEWLLGSWKGEYNNNTIIEEWKKISDNKFRGHSYYIIENDTNHIEELRLEILDDDIYYAADVPHNKSVVSFILISQKPNEVIFENKHHDYPSRITYTFQQPNNLSAKISGRVNDELKEDFFYYIRSDN